MYTLYMNCWSKVNFQTLCLFIATSAVGEILFDHNMAYKTKSIFTLRSHYTASFTCLKLQQIQNTKYNEACKYGSNGTYIFSTLY